MGCSECPGQCSKFPSKPNPSSKMLRAGTAFSFCACTAPYSLGPRTGSCCLCAAVSPLTPTPESRVMAWGQSWRGGCGAVAEGPRWVALAAAEGGCLKPPLQVAGSLAARWSVPISLITFCLPTRLVILHVLFSVARSYGAPQGWLQARARWPDAGSRRRAWSGPWTQGPLPSQTASSQGCQDGPAPTVTCWFHRSSSDL